MKIFGCYFETENGLLENPAGKKSNRGWRKFWRAYSTILLCLTWANMFRFIVVFKEAVGFGPELLLRLNFIGILLFGSLNRTVYYVACNTGHIRETLANTSKLDFDVERVRKRSIILALVHWGGTVFCCGTFVYHGLIYKGFQMISVYQIEPLPMYFQMSNNEIIIANIVFIIMNSFSGAGFSNPFYFNCILSFIFQQEFIKIKLDIEGKLPSESCLAALSTQIITNFDIETSRRKHHRLTKFVRIADTFVSISNGICIISMITTSILVLYSLSFYTRIYNDFGTVFTSGCFLIVALGLLAMMSLNAIVVNDAVMYRYVIDRLNIEST